jgi:hypothetical protein
VEPVSTSATEGHENGMSRTGKRTFRAITIPLAFGLMQLAPDPALAVAPHDPVEVRAINRADRPAGVGRSALQMRILFVRFDGLAANLVRAPTTRGSSKRTYAPSRSKSVDRSVGCEPAVSILSEVFARLPPGRCMT